MGNGQRGSHIKLKSLRHPPNAAAAQSRCAPAPLGILHSIPPRRRARGGLQKGGEDGGGLNASREKCRAPASCCLPDARERPRPIRLLAGAAAAPPKSPSMPPPSSSSSPSSWPAMRRSSRTVPLMGHTSRPLERSSTCSLGGAAPKGRGETGNPRAWQRYGWGRMRRGHLEELKAWRRAGQRPRLLCGAPAAAPAGPASQALTCTPRRTHGPRR
jgi:hypothetical protein